MPDKSLQARTMRKTVERVDIGAFGIPMRVVGWIKKTKSSWGGWAAMTAAQAAVGVLIAVIAGLILGVPINPFSIIIIVGFALGSAIGGPFSFAIWTAILIGISGLGAGFIADAWVASPSWWRTLAAGWEQNSAVPGWFKVAVPAWMLLWIAAARGMAKVSEMILEKLALRMGFKAAQRFSGEDKRVYDEAFEQSDVSEAETASLLESSGDGTHSVITGEPSKLAGIQRTQVREMGGDPDVSSVPLPATDDGIDYDSFLDAGSSDPDVMKAVGKKPTGLEPLHQPGDDAQTAVSDAATGVVIEMEPLDLPAVPRDTAPPLQRVEPPKLDPRQNRALFRRMTQLNLAFQNARREDRDAEFIDKHQEELAVISDEQRMILESMADTGPLLALIHTIQRKRTEDFLVGRADAPVAPGVGTIEGPAAIEDDDDVPFAVGAAIPVITQEATQQPVTPEAEPVPVDAVDEPIPATPVVDQPEVDVVLEKRPAGRRNIAAMAASFSDILSPKRQRDADAAAASDDARSDDVDVDAPTSDLDASSDTEETSDTPSSSNVDDRDVAAAAHPAPVEVSAEIEPVHGVSDASAPAPAELLETKLDRGSAEFPFEFDVELQADASEADVAQMPTASPDDAVAQPETSEGTDVESPSADANQPSGEVARTDDGVNQDVAEREPEEEMSNRVFSRSVCRQVLGLVVGPLDPESKADDIRQFESSNAGVTVTEVLNSRSFDEQVGSTEAAAARHAWKDVKHVLSQSSLERLLADLERVNQRGQAMVEEPHTLSVAAYHAFESESSRLRRVATAPGDDDALELSGDLVGKNVAILDTLAAILKARSEAAAAHAAIAPSGVVRQRVAPDRDDVAASRGRGLIGSVLGGARTSGVGVMRDAPAKAPAPATEIATVAEAIVLEAPEAPVVETNLNEEHVMSDAATETSTMEPAVVASELRPGDEGFISMHPIDSIQYQVDMDMHAAGVLSRQRVVNAAKERVEQEERDRQKVIDDAAAVVRGESEAALARQRAADDAEEERRREAAAAEEKRREEIARIEREGVEATAAAAALALERERSQAARTKEDEDILRQHRERQKELDIPERFRTDEVVAHVMAISELRNIRYLFQRSVISAGVQGLSDLEAAMRVPSVRSQLQTDAEMVREAAGILTRIASVVDATDPEDVAAVRSVLHPEEIPFFDRTIGWIERGRSAQSTLDRADAADRDIRAKAERAGDAVALETRLTDANAELVRVRGEASSSDEAMRAANQRAEAAEIARKEAADKLDKLLKEMSGIVDDDFQQILDSNAKRIEAGGIDGFFSLMSPDGSSMVMIMTTPASAFPEGLIQRGSKSLTVADFLEFVVSRARDFATDHVAVLYTDPQMRAYASNTEGMTLKQVRRSVDELKSMLGDYGINIDIQGDK